MRKRQLDTNEPFMLRQLDFKGSVHSNYFYTHGRYFVVFDNKVQHSSSASSCMLVEKHQKMKDLKIVKIQKRYNL